MRQGIVWSLAVAALLSACEPTAEATAPQGSLASQTDKSQEDFVPVPPRNMESALSNLLAVFVSDQGRQWMAYASIPGVTFDKAPGEYADGKYDQDGHLLLAGFGRAKLPNGKSGVDYAEVDGNEGESGVTLVGDVSHVQSMSIKKFYFTEDYQDTLRRQFPNTNTVERIAHGCAAEEDAEIAANNEFFRINLDNGDVTYIEAYLEAGESILPVTPCSISSERSPREESNN